MSRLTEKVGNKVYAVEACELMPFGNAGKVIRKILNKLSKYEDIGEPSELIRPVRCGECRFAGSRSLGAGLISGLSSMYCETWKDFTDRDTYCSRGERRQSDG